MFLRAHVMRIEKGPVVTLCGIGSVMLDRFRFFPPHKWSRKMAMSKTQKREARLNSIPVERREREDRPRMRPLRPDEIKRRAAALREATK